MIWQLLLGFVSGNVSDAKMAQLLLQFAATVFVVALCLPAHEFAHAWAAKKLGDNTAFMHGRLTLNPAKHLDVMGTLMVLVVGFGYAKPVPVNPRNFRNRKKGMALTAAAGPLANLLLAVVLMFIGQLLGALYSLFFAGSVAPDLMDLIWEFFAMASSINVALMLFNLIPVPPLDGSRILDMLLPARASLFLARYERWLYIGVLAMVFFWPTPLNWLAGLVSQGIYALTGLPFFWVEGII
ncbi:MAG: site-2 protease family protein [Oscillospiraceae bacterium]|jgi:Zn-dependent protease|nr:site-2 protease family protein [Oscillospiraceae bacterium]